MAATKSLPPYPWTASPAHSPNAARQATRNQHHPPRRIRPWKLHMVRRKPWKLHAWLIIPFHTHLLIENLSHLIPLICESCTGKEAPASHHILTHLPHTLKAAPLPHHPLPRSHAIQILQGAGSRVQGAGCREQGAGSRVQAAVMPTNGTRSVEVHQEMGKARNPGCLAKERGGRPDSS